MWSLGERDLFAVVNSFQDRPLLHLRHHFEDKGEWMPTRKGITLTLAEWTVLKNHLEDIDRSFQREIANLNNERKSQSLIPEKPDLDHIDYTPWTGGSRFAHLSEASQGALRHALPYWHSRFISVHTRLVRICRLVSGWAHSLHLFEDHSTPCLPKHLSQSMLAHCASNGSPPSGGIVTAVSLTARRSWTTTNVACWSQRNSWRATIIKLDWLWMKMPYWL